MFGHQDEPSKDDPNTNVATPLSAPPLDPPPTDATTSTNQSNATPPATDTSAASSPMTSTIIQPEVKPDAAADTATEMPPELLSDKVSDTSSVSDDSSVSASKSTSASSSSTVTSEPVSEGEDSSQNEMDLHNEAVSDTPSPVTPIEDELNLPEPSLSSSTSDLRSSDTSDLSDLTAAAAPSISPVVKEDDDPKDESLLSIKQEALQQLSPLVGQLQQSAEEKFHTTMMMIQASDDQSLIQKAFEAAKEITDDKARAQALLDIVNEINYFTQNQTTAAA